MIGDQVREGEEGCQDAGDGDGGVHHLLAALLPHQRHLGDMHGLHQQPGRRLPGTALIVYNDSLFISLHML